MPAYDSWDPESARDAGSDSGSIHCESTESAMHSDPIVVMRMGFEPALILLGDASGPAGCALRRLEDAAAEWARDAIPIDTVQHAIHDGVKLTLNRIDPAGRYRYHRSVSFRPGECRYRGDSHVV